MTHNDKYFTPAEAWSKVGRRVRTRVAFSGVPQGTTGVVLVPDDHLRGVYRGRARQCRQAARAAHVAWHSCPAEKPGPLPEPDQGQTRPDVARLSTMIEQCEAQRSTPEALSFCCSVPAFDPINYFDFFPNPTLEKSQGINNGVLTFFRLEKSRSGKKSKVYGRR